MIRGLLSLSLSTAALSLALPAHASPIGHAGRVVAYEQGTQATSFASYDNPDAALGESPTDTGSFGGVTFYVTPFNNPWSSADSVSIGTGGYLTLELDHYALPLIGGPEIGVFAYQQLLQTGGGTDSGPTTFYDSQQAIVDVSANGSDWVSLNSGDLITFDIPANAFQDEAATLPSDYHLPFTDTLADLANLGSFAEVLAAYNGSAGGTWLDISGTGLSQVGYVRFTVPIDAGYSVQLEGVSIATGAIGAAVPEPASGLLLLASLALLRRRHNRGAP